MHDEAWHSDRIKEECGVTGIFTRDGHAARLSFFTLFALQHRGQESTGIAVSDGDKVRMHRDMGLVSQVFNEEILETLVGNMAIGHTRYSTTGASVSRNAQPIFCTSQVGEIAVAHNGNLINAVEIREEMEAEGETFESTADSEVIARLIITNLHNGIEEAVRVAMKKIQGAYSVAVLTKNEIIGFRDPHGVRPLSAGTMDDGWMIASETCAFGPVGGEVTHEIQPGECVIISNDGMRFVQVVPTQRPAMCMFEFIYFARPDSVMYDTTLYGARKRMGEELFNEYPVEADIVVPVPDSGIPAALGYSDASGIPYCEGMSKSRYIHRTFIQPDQRMRERGVRMKLSPIDEHIKGQRIVLVDDSIVRGTTTTQIVKMLYDAGAKEVHVRITAPPIKYPCFYGIDMASKGELVAAVKTIDEIGEHLGADSLGYLSIPGVVKAVRSDLGKSSYCLACFSGEYPIDVPKDLTKMAFEKPPEVGEMAAIKVGQIPLFTEDSASED
jgi:amidophosphoribosyltransferase